MQHQNIWYFHTFIVMHSFWHQNTIDCLKRDPKTRSKNFVSYHFWSAEQKMSSLLQNYSKNKNIWATQCLQSYFLFYMSSTWKFKLRAQTVKTDTWMVPQSIFKHSTPSSWPFLLCNDVRASNIWAKKCIQKKGLCMKHSMLHNKIKLE